MVNDHSASLVVNDHSALLMVNDHSALLMVNDHSALLMVNDHSASLVVNDHTQSVTKPLMAPNTSMTTAAKLALLLILAVVIVSEAKGRKLKETNIVFYMHDYETGTNISTVAVTGNPKNAVAYNGSTLEIQGANRFFQKYIEMSVVSGTGVFQFARGYAILETVFIDIPNLTAIIRWNVTVLHY
ncbi:hypothetical protein HHK36_003277 [Tetracentron sinense]|uniref:Dirigent protein n=1 Tax=Tetracentron sinense TaxID=13715 RepID=A0A834ZSM7_TETSI|nr:hypothetical protein HHK36_003277 [Tetracentron sinense]